MWFEAARFLGLGGFSKPSRQQKCLQLFPSASIMDDTRRLAYLVLSLHLWIQAQFPFGRRIGSGPLSSRCSMSVIQSWFCLCGFSVAPCESEELPSIESQSRSSIGVSKDLIGFLGSLRPSATAKKSPASKSSPSNASAAVGGPGGLFGISQILSRVEFCGPRCVAFD